MGNNTAAEKKVHNERAVAATKPVGDKKLDKDLDRVRTEMIHNYAHDADEVDRALIENLSTKIRFDDYRNTYIEGECLGEGGFGAVYRCTSKSDGQDYAVKIMKKVVALANDRDTVREINLMLHADHPNLVQIKEVYHVDRKPLVLVMDLVEPGTDKQGMVMETPDLMTILMEGPLNMTETAKVVYQTAAAVDFLNTRCNAMHRDLKPDNILIGPEMFQRIRVTDYGQGRIFSDVAACLSQALRRPSMSAPMATMLRRQSRPAGSVWGHMAPRLMSGRWASSLTCVLLAPLLSLSTAGNQGH